MGPAEPDEEAHGYSSNHDMELARPLTTGPSRLTLAYPDASPVERVSRKVTPDPSAAAVDIEFSVVVRRACRLPIGLHPVFRLPDVTGGAKLELGPFGEGLTYPHDVEPGAELFARDKSFAGLSSVPARRGGVIDASRLPLADDTEELLQIDGLDGAAALANQAEGYRVKLSWQKAHFPSLLLWYSNRGRKGPPWSERHVSIGIEPICSPFGLGPATAQADNPIAQSGVPTALEFSPETPFTTRYRIEASAL